MWNRSHDQSIEIHNYNTVTPSAQDQRYDNSGLAAVCIVTIVAATIIGVVRSIQFVLVHLIDALAGVVGSLITILPWLAGMAILMALVYWFFLSLPEALQEVQEIRYRRMIASRQPLMIEQQSIDTQWAVVEEGANVEAK